MQQEIEPDEKGNVPGEKEQKFGDEQEGELVSATVERQEDNPVENSLPGHVEPEKVQNKGGSWVRRNRWVLITSAVLGWFLVSTGVALGVYTWDKGLIVEGVTISGVQVGNLTRDEARQKLGQKISALLDQSVKLNVEGTVLEVKLSQLGLNLVAEEALDTAYRIGREGSMAQKAVSKRKATQGVSFSLDKRWDDKVLTEALNTNLGKFNQAAVDASFTITPENTMQITAEKTGKLIDTDSLISQIKALDFMNPNAVNVAFNADTPKLTAAQLESQRITGLVASYSTNFDAGQTNRAENVRVAAKVLDGVIIKPGDTFSFNALVGNRNVANGYREAPVILNGELVPGLGGGVCQVSTTLYNVVLLADLSIVERSNHSLTIHYAPMGQDATVSYPSLDLKFKNDSGSYLVLRSKVSGGTISFYLYGQPKPERQVLITNSTDSVIPAKEKREVDNSLPSGTVKVKQEGSPGYVVSSYRTVQVNGQVTKKESLGKSVYQASPRIVVVGP